MLSIRNLGFSIGGKPLFEGASATIPHGHRVGLVGRNGAGKSTLFRLIRGEYTPQEGEIDIHPRTRIGWVAQEAPDGPESLIDTVLAGDSERAALLAELESDPPAERIADIHARLGILGAHSAEGRAVAILSGLGFSPDEQKRPCADFSGGWRMRIAIAAALFATPDLLLLDEPTNHLDLEAALWLDGYLSRYPHSLIIISHDRGILNRAVNHILHLNNRRLDLYGGPFDTFLKLRAQKLQQREKEAEKTERRRAHLQAFVDRFRYKATKAKQAQSRLKMLEKLQPVIIDADEAPPRFAFPEPDDLPPPLFSCERVSVGYEPGKPVLRNLSLRFDMDDRIALLGANGNGKSTFAKLIAGELTAEGGTLSRHPKMRIGYFAQHQLEQLDPATSAYETLSRLAPREQPERLRALLGGFGFAQEKADLPVAQLSGGEKARLVMCLLSRIRPHLLILDEPTNHLDIESREALIDALNAYRGAVVLISHDEHLVSLVADRLYLVADGTIRRYDGDMNAYRNLILNRAREQQPQRRQRNTEAAPTLARGGNAAERRRRLAPLRQAAREAERRLEKLMAENTALDERLADPALYDDAKADIPALQKRKAALTEEIAAAEDAWLQALEAVEEAENNPPSRS